MFKRAESFFLGPKKTRLFYQLWEPSQVRGHLLITHGQAEHSGAYQRLIDGLKDLSYAVYAWDLRGHGRSDGQRGYVGDFTDYTKDFEAFLHTLREERNLYPEDLVVLGHSMGGLIQLKTLLDNPHWNFKAQILSSPMLGVAVEVPLYKDLAALVFSKLLPNFTLGNEIKYEDLTQDPEVLGEYTTDFLRHDRISASAYLGAISAIETLRSQIWKIKTPTLWQIPEHDPVVGSDPSRDLFQKLGSSQKLLKIYPNRKHEIYNDLGREAVFADIHEFLNKLKSK
jgi:alpha-beta hydrolase superfamily lysophospholipase